MALQQLHNQYPTSLDIRISSNVEDALCNPLYLGDDHIKRFKNY